MDDLKNLARFVLDPFQEQDFTSRLHISGTLARSATSLRISYALRGCSEEVLLPLADIPARRRDGLWQATCFEFFVGKSGSPQYLEVNLAPSGDWNVYSFSGYRQEMREETAIASLPCTQHRQSEFYQLALDFPLAQLIAPDQPVDIAVSVILQGHNGERAFYALTHCGPQPDFHLRESFLIRL